MFSCQGDPETRFVRRDPASIYWHRFTDDNWTCFAHPLRICATLHRAIYLLSSGSQVRILPGTPLFTPDFADFRVVVVPAVGNKPLLIARNPVALYSEVPIELTFIGKYFNKLAQHIMRALFPYIRTDTIRMYFLHEYR